MRLLAVTALLVTLLTAPAGASTAVPGCAHPVVLVHGTADNKDHTWRALDPLLAQHGHCAFALTYGVPPGAGNMLGGLMPMDYSARQLESFVDSVLTATGAAKVDVVGYSQGTLVPTYYAKFLDGAGKIDRYVSLAPAWDGTNVDGLADLYELLRPLGPITGCAVCPELLTGSDLLRRLRAGGVFLPGITYTNIVSTDDGVIIPYTSGLGHGPNVTNVVLQHITHADMPVAPAALAHVIAALARS